MGLFVPGGERRSAPAEPGEELRRSAERRRKKLENQEKRVKRLSSPLSVWFVKVFRVLAPPLTALMALAEYFSCRDAEAYYGFADYPGRISCTALAMWSVFGGVWFFASLVVLHNIKTGKADSGEREKAASYRRGAIVSLSVWIALAAGFAVSAII